jgi:hypothetical protein
MSEPKLFSRERKVYHLYNDRHHLKHPIPYPLEVIPIGKASTHEEWEKFCEKHLTPKEQLDCARKRDGTLNFIGEGGLDALVHFQEKFKDRFHLRMICANEAYAVEGLQLAKEKGLKIRELRYKDEHVDVMLNDEKAIHQLSTKRSFH